MSSAKIGTEKFGQPRGSTTGVKSGFSRAGAGNLGGGGNVCSADMDQVSEFQLAKSLLG